MVLSNGGINEAGKILLKTVMEKLGFSTRAYHRIFKLARTITDLALTEDNHIGHLAEAIQHRMDASSTKILNVGLGLVVGGVSS